MEVNVINIGDFSNSSWKNATTFPVHPLPPHPFSRSIDKERGNRKLEMFCYLQFSFKCHRLNIPSELVRRELFRVARSCISAWMADWWDWDLVGSI
ncbi:hypothetical protein CEXT_587421 [Caerostris extrusa]|uniref:Uncharacterized protein n=1 Tax=Caerostris extrusa TaxID=172846 RepID=A0AAV4Y5W3_CAEEX|nr:hypothetical protein CEXT_587421 [Caerostris extrusa]